MRAPLYKRLRRKLRQPVSRAKGFALLTVAVTLAVLGAIAEDFSYNTRVDLEAAANSRDQLRAEYLARSGIQLARLLIKVQQTVLDPNRKYVGDVQIAEFAPYLIKAFGGEADERAGLGSLLGLDVSTLKGLGAGKGATFDLAMSSEDGRLNLNCGGGLNGAANQKEMWAVLNALFWPPRYSPPLGRVFDINDADGQLYTREDVARAILDWADIDEARFDPTGNSSGAENYGYDAGKDPYKPRNHYFDTVEELNLVRGVGDEMWGSFGDMFTTYGGCKINVAAMQPEHWPLMAAVLRATVKDANRNDPILLDDVKLAGMAQQVLSLAKMMGGFQATDDFVKWVSDPAGALTSLFSKNSPPPPTSPPAGGGVGIPLDSAKVGKVLMVGPRRLYRLDATGTVQRTREKRIQVHIRAIWDTQHFNQNTMSGDVNDRLGTWVYFRED